MLAHVTATWIKIPFSCVVFKRDNNAACVCQKGRRTQDLGCSSGSPHYMCPGPNSGHSAYQWGQNEFLSEDYMSILFHSLFHFFWRFSLVKFWKI